MLRSSIRVEATAESRHSRSRRWSTPPLPRSAWPETGSHLGETSLKTLERMPFWSSLTVITSLPSVIVSQCEIQCVWRAMDAGGCV